MRVDFSEEGSGDVVPDAEERSWDSSHGICGEVHGGEAGSQSAVLHSDLNGDGDSLLPFHAQKASDEESEGQSAAVVQEDNNDDHPASLHEFFRIMCYDNHDDDGNDDGGESGQISHGLLCVLRQYLLDDEARHYW